MIPPISGDGNRVAFVTRFAADALDANNDTDVYLRDLAAGTTQLVSRKGAAGPAGNDGSGEPAIDADGSHIAFSTDANDFSANPDANTDSDIWVRDVPGGQVALVSRAASGSATADDGSFAPAISADGNRDRVREHCDEPGRGGRRERRRPGRLPARHGRRHDLARQRHRRERMGSPATPDRNVRRSMRPAPASRSRPSRPTSCRAMPTAGWTCSCATRSR